MKTKKLKIFVSIMVIMLAVACEYDDLADDELAQNDEAYLKSGMADTTTMNIVPDVVVEDQVLQEHAVVSQYGEAHITYTYDRYGRLFYINYYKRHRTGLTSNTADIAPRYVYMQDRFVYNNAGRLAEILRYSRSNSPQLTNILVAKSYRYNSAGQLSVIVTRRPNIAVDAEAIAAREKYEFLYYDKRGNMVKKVVKEPTGRSHFFIYMYDRSNRLTKIAGYGDANSNLKFICNLFYDNRNNIARKEFYYPSPLATSVNDISRRWVVHYRYDKNFNPFKNFRLPVSSLFEWMDVISPNNISAIKFENGTTDRTVFYKYRYNTLGYPILRVRVNALPYTDAAE